MIKPGKKGVRVLWLNDDHFVFTSLDCKVLDVPIHGEFDLLNGVGRIFEFLVSY